MATIPRACLTAWREEMPRERRVQVLALVRPCVSSRSGSEENPLRERLGRYLERLTGQRRLGTTSRHGGWFSKLPGPRQQSGR